MKKMIVVDLDGTLLDINQNCSKNSIKYLKRLKELGYIIVIATGRVLKSAIEVTDGALFANYIIANAGALIYDMDTKRIVMKSDISKNDMIDIYNSYNSEIDYINVCDLYCYNRCIGNDYRSSKDVRIVSDVNSFLNNCEDRLHITVKFIDNRLVDKYYDMYNRDSLEILVMQDSFTDRKWLEIFNKDVSKYNAIDLVRGLENVSNSDVISFGDGLNDVEMIEMCGIGVAMGNALDEVKEVSDYITTSHNNDGVIYFLKKYFRENNLVG